MSMEQNSHSSDIAQRFAHIESAYEYHQLIGQETISVDELPVFVRLGRLAATTFAIINQDTDLNEAERGTGENGLNPRIPTFLIEPSVYDLHEGRGYKALRNGETIELGRSHQPETSRFSPLPSIISRSHASLEKSADGKSVTITDKNSMHGTEVGRLPVENTLANVEAYSTQHEAQAAQHPEHLFVREARATSLASESHPDRNEDSFILDESNNLYGVFDGMGGHNNGQFASHAAKSIISKQALGGKNINTLKGNDRFLKKTLSDAHDFIAAHAPEAGTTAVLAKLFTLDGKDYATIAHVGDSRAYILRDGTLQSLTLDHTPYSKKHGYKEAKDMQERLATTETMAALDQADFDAFYNRNVIGACLGHGTSNEPDVLHVPVYKGDVLLLTSDGIHDNLTTQEIEAIIKGDYPIDYSELLANEAQTRSQEAHDRAKKDDMTALVIRI